CRGRKPGAFADRAAALSAERSHRQRPHGVPQRGRVSDRSRFPWGMIVSTALLSAATIAPAVAPTEPEVPEGPDRPADQTFLTYPEWFLVFSPQERAAYLSSRNAPSRFPYLGHVKQLWEGYRAVARATRDYPFNFGYHAMIVVISTSTTVEYGL